MLRDFIEKHSTVLISNEAEMEAFASTLALILYPGASIALEGTLGAGKTFFTRALLHHLGVHTPVSSPTYTLINEYETVLNGKDVLIRHMDAYRIKTTSELWDLGVDEMLRDESIFIVEWADKFPDVFSSSNLKMQIHLLEDEKRKLILK